jgi:DNA-binding IclR family transcriptional regulator
MVERLRGGVMNPPKNGIRAVQTSLDLLDALQRLDGAGVSDLADELGTTKGTVHNHLSTLAHNDYVVKEDDDTYQIGFRFLDLAHHARQRVGIYEIVRPEVDKLAGKSGEMALFTVEEHGLGVCLYRALGDDAVDTALYIGRRDTLHHTAVGKAILAHLPEKRVREIVDHRGLPAITPETITDEEALFEELAEVREQGFAFNQEESIPGLVGVGAPILEQNGDVVGAVSIIGPDSRMDEDRFYGELPDMITRSVNIIQVNATSI